jgi:uncharacterized protein (TIGR00299 family) protein
MKAIYLDLISGISGDMFLGALLDIGASADSLKKTLSTLDIQFDVKVDNENDVVSGINVEVLTTEKKGRKVQEIIRLIEKSKLDKWVKEKSIQVFTKIGNVEATIHGNRDVHLHEVGMVDSIIDIVGVISAIKQLGIEKIYSSPIPLGRGCIQSQHGLLPVPAPATIELVTGLPVYFTPIETEIVTPTGAGLLSILVDEFTYPSLLVENIGYGFGKRKLPQLNALRIISGIIPEENKENIWQIEANIDDYNPEFHDHLITRLLSLGALDVTITPVLMKKGRLGVVLTVLSSIENLDDLQDAVFLETSTLGIRIKKINRITLPRMVISVTTTYGKARVKIAKWKDKIVTISPEYEDCKKLAMENNIPLKKIFYEVKKNAEKKIKKDLNS